MQIVPIAHMRTPYPVKFGVPRQPGLVDALVSSVVFEGEYADPHALRGIETFDRIWIIWGFSHNDSAGWTPTVRPPRLGGTRRMGVFATRSSFRPNALGLSCVQLVRVDLEHPEGPRLVVSGADMVDGTPVFDIKPYLPFCDSDPLARSGWVEEEPWEPLKVDISEELLSRVPNHLRAGLVQLLEQDPRPAYTRTGDEARVFWVPLEDFAVRFTVSEASLQVVDVVALDDDQMRTLRETGTVVF